MTVSVPDAGATWDDRCLVEAVRRLEAGDANAFDTQHLAAATAEAKAAVAPFEEKLIIRAQSLPVAASLYGSFQQFRKGLTASLAVALFAAALAGAASVPTALRAIDSASGAGAVHVVNFHWAVVSLIGIETIALLAWLAFTLASRGRPLMLSLGGAIYLIRQRLSHWFKPQLVQSAGFETMATLLQTSGRLGWLAGAATHAFWLAYLLSALFTVLIFLSLQHMRFGWETTILSDAFYLETTQWLAWLPALAGFATPDGGQIALSQWTGDAPPPADTAEAWAGMLIGALVLYAILPRFILLVVCWLMQRHKMHQFRLDLTRPSFVRLRGQIMGQPRPESKERPGSQEGNAPAPPDPAAPPASPIPIPQLAKAGQVALIALECSEFTWPTAIGDLDLVDLGSVDGRQDQKRIVARLEEMAPRLLIIAVSLLTTPDRGTAAFLNRLRHIGDIPQMLWLLDSADLRHRLPDDQCQLRHQDWQRLAYETGIPASWVFAAADDDDTSLVRTTLDAVHQAEMP